MYSAYQLNKQSDNMHPSCSPFPTLNQLEIAPYATFFFLVIFIFIFYFIIFLI